MELQNKPPTLGNLTSNFVCFILMIMYFKMFILEIRMVADSSFHASHYFIASKNDCRNSNLFLSTILGFRIFVWNEVGGTTSTRANSGLVLTLPCTWVETLRTPTLARVARPFASGLSGVEWSGVGGGASIQRSAGAASGSDLPARLPCDTGTSCLLHDAGVVLP